MRCLPTFIERMKGARDDKLPLDASTIEITREDEMHPVDTSTIARDF